MNLEEYIRPYNKLLNIVLQKKFKWFEKIELDDLKYGGVRGQKNFINPVGKIYVDSNWVYKQWREYHYDTPFYYDEELNFGDIIGGDLSEEIQKQFKICFSQVVGEFIPKYMSFSWLTVVLVDKKEDTIKETIRRILKEQGEQHKEEAQKKLNLVRKMIHRLYDNVSFIEQSTFNGKPHLTIYFDSDDTAANVESWFDEKIYRDIIELTSGSIVVCPDWAANWDSRKKEADVYINTELLRYDNLGNVINESSKSIRRILREESRPLKIMRRTHLIDNEIEKILKNPYFPKKVCKTYINTEQFITSVCEFCFRSLYSNTFYMMDDTSEEWEKIVVFIYEYVKDRYSEILKDYYKKHCGKRVETNESDPKVGTGKKPKGSGRRLYTDENPSDTVSVKFKTKQDIIDTLNKQSFKSKPHKRQSQIINLIHQRVRAAYQNSKNSETKKRLKTALDYIEIQKEKSKQKTIRLQKK